MNIGNLLQLQRALERDRVIDPAPEIQEVAPLVETARDLLDLLIAFECLLEQQRELRQRVEMRFRILGLEHAADLSEIQRKQLQRDEL